MRCRMIVKMMVLDALSMMILQSIYADDGKKKRRTRYDDSKNDLV
jgi:hypothetical protein